VSPPPIFDAARATVVLEPATFAELLGLAAGDPPSGTGARAERDALQRAGVTVDGAVHEALADGVQALLSPMAELELQHGAQQGEGRLDGCAAVLVLPEGDSLRVHAVPVAFLPAALARLVQLGPRPRVEPAQRLPFSSAEFARTLVGAAPAPPALGSVHRHWRFVSRWPSPTRSMPGEHGVEVLDAEHGLWLVVPDGADIELWPTTPSQVWRRLVGLVPANEEVDPALFEGP